MLERLPLKNIFHG